MKSGFFYKNQVFKSLTLIRKNGFLVNMKSNQLGYCRKSITTSVLIGIPVYPVLNFKFDIFHHLDLLVALSLLLVHFSVPVSRSVSPFLIPFINDHCPGHENQTFTMTTTNSGMSQRLLFVVCVVWCGVCV